MGIVKAKDLTFEYIRRDEEGNVIPEYDETIEIRIDTQSPTVTLEAPEGFSTWYQKEAWIRVVSEDGAWEARLIRLHVMLGIKLLENQRRISQSFLNHTDFKKVEKVCR